MEILRDNNKEENRVKTSAIPQEQQTIINKARALYYHLFGMFLIYGELEKKYEETAKTLEQIFLNPMNDSNKEDAFKLIKEFETNQAKNITHEFNELFINNFNTKAINLTMSYYDEGYERGEKYLLAKEMILKSRFRRAESFIETEDDLGFLCLLNASLLDEEKQDATILAKGIFSTIINPYVNFIIVEILKSSQAVFYKPIARLLASFMEFERIYLNTDIQKYQAFIDKSEALYQEKNQRYKKRQKTDFSLKELVDREKGK